MQNEKKKSKPLNLIKGAFNNQSPQSDPDVENSRIEQPNRKPVRTVSGSLNLIAEAFTQKDREEDDKDGELQEKIERKVTEPLKMNEQSLVRNSQEEKYRQITPLQDRKVRNDTEPLNPIKESLDS